jgi:CBS domain-containing protein
MVTVKEIMKRDVVSVPYGAPVVQAAKMMRHRKIGSVFVRLEGRVVGIVTEPDIVREVVGTERNPALITVEDVMSFPVIEIEERSALTEAADLMERHATRHLAVTKSGELVGVVSVRDLLHPVSIDEF